MYQMVIAEDDERMRLVVEKIIPWEKDIYSICCSCSNGLDAKTYIDNYPVDVAILDINMPKMDGLELARYIYENYPQILVVLISAYKEFEYAKRAMEYDVLDYITKPITKASIEKTFEKVLKKLKNRTKSLFLDDSKIVKRQQLFFGIMNNRLTSSQIDLINQLKCFNINIDCDNYHCAKLNIEIEKYDDFINSIWHRDKEAFYEILQRIITADEFRTYFSVLSTDGKYMEFVAISKRSNNRQFENELEQDIKHFQNDVNDIFGISVKFVTIDKFQSINLYLDSLKSDERIKNQVLFTMNYLINGEKETMLQCIRDAEKIIVSEDKLIVFYRKVITRFEENLERLEKMFIRDEYFATNSIRDVSELKAETIKLAEKTFDILFCENLDENAIIYEAKRYIDNNYKKDLSLQDVADLVSLNACYFSSVFKKYAGVGFSAYLNQVRMSKAKGLLENTSLKTQAIAAEVGFKEVTYFYRIFKSITGQTPIEYRNRIKEMRKNE